MALKRDDISLQDAVKLRRKCRMTEVEWVASTDPDSMLSFLEGKTSERKLTLYSCAMQRVVWHLLDARVQRTVQALGGGSPRLPRRA